MTRLKPCLEQPSTQISISMPNGIEFTKIDELPSYEALQLASRLDQVIVPKTSPALNWSLLEHKTFIAAYHACQSVAAFLNQCNISVPFQHFGRLLPSVRYHRRHPCRFCGKHQYTRKIATHSAQIHGNKGFLKCDGCNARIYLSKGLYYGEEYSLQPSPKQTKSDTPHNPKAFVDFAFLDALFKRYVPEYQHAPLHSYLSGTLSLSEVQERTGITLASRDEL